MPFCKRTIAPKDLCKDGANGQSAIFGDLVDVCGFTLCSALRQLADLSRQSVSILEELEGEFVSICHRSGTLECKVIGLQKYISSLATKSPTKTTTNLDAESKRAAHFRSSWQQHVNVFGSWSRPECVQQLRQEAELNLQSLLQDFEEHLYEPKVTGQTFRHPSSLSSEDTSLSDPPGLISQKPEFIFLPASSEECEGGATPIGFWSQEHSITAEKPPWPPSGRAQEQQWPTDTTGDEALLHVDLIQGICGPESDTRLLTPSPETQSPHLFLRKTYSDLEQNLLHSPGSPSGAMEHAGLMCGSPSWNGPKGSTFSPSWNNSMDYVMAHGPATKPPTNQQQADLLLDPSQSGSSLSYSSGSHSSSFTSNSVEPSARALATTSIMAGKRAETEGAAASPRDREKRPMRPGALRFRERSLSTPTDSESFCSADNVSCMDTQRLGAESYALMYPSGSSEDGASADNESLAVTDFHPDGRLRIRSRSISLKKSKKKPPPPVRSVSLVKNLRGARAEGPQRESRPRSLYLPREHLHDSYLSDYVLGGDGRSLKEEPDIPLSIRETMEGSQAPDQEVELSFPDQWQLNEWHSSDPYRSLSGSSTATGTTVIECLKARGSSESLDSPGTSRATSPSQFSVEAEAKISPFKPHGLMSPSSGYSSQSETPTPTIPSAQVTGPSPLACKMRPKIPERKSSLPATSPMERPARSRLSFELPVASASELPSIKPKPKASRRHSDTSPTSQSGQPVVTQTDLRNVRLRSVGRSEIEDNLDCPVDIIEEEQMRDDDSPPVTLREKPKPPVAVKPPLPKRPLNLMLESPSSSLQGPESPPISPKEWRMPVGNIYMVVKKPKKKPLQAAPIATQEIPQHQEVLDIQQGASHIDLPSPSSPKKEHQTRTLTSSVTVSCLAELDRKRIKVPPPVPKKPSVLLLPSSVVHSNGADDSGPPSPGGERVSEEFPAVEESQVQTKQSEPQDSDVTAFPTGTLTEMEALHISEEPTEGVFGLTPTPHTTEDLFTIIHRSKRKVLGRREPSATFTSRPSLVSPVRTDPRSHTLGATPRSSSRNQNFMALLQKKNNKPSTGSRVSAMELLKSTNPLARRVTEFNQSELDPTDGPRTPQGQ
nr:NHS-like protein 2 isoform X2 [Paramormyrops kingsleyae]